MELSDNALTNAAPKSRGLAASRWWRWTRYELREGCICPAPGAKFRPYDPWKLWRKTRPVGRRSDSGAQGATPYRALLEMLRKLEYRGNTGDAPRFPPLETDALPAPLTAESEQAVLDWCADYGLLGILPHRVLQVILWPRDGEQVHYIRLGCGWLAVTRDRQNASTPVQPPIALVQPVLGSGISIEPLSKTWARFFPNVPPTIQEIFAYPQPLTPPFWGAYGEPLADFLSGARALKTLLDGIELQQKNRALRLLHAAVSGGTQVQANSLVAPMGLGVRVKKKHIELSWVGNSLLSALAVMLLEDLSRGRVLQCLCGQVFVSTAYQARYCSKRCRWRFEQRDYRSPRKRRRRKDPAQLTP
ncbi:MAG: hypothetical protein ABSD31_17345 [Candidatus Binataceae bacterium]